MESSVISLVAFQCHCNLANAIKYSHTLKYNGITCAIKDTLDQLAD